MAIISKLNLNLLIPRFNSKQALSFRDRFYEEVPSEVSSSYSYSGCGVLYNFHARPPKVKTALPVESPIIIPGLNLGT